MAYDPDMTSERGAVRRAAFQYGRGHGLEGRPLPSSFRGILEPGEGAAETPEGAIIPTVYEPGHFPRDLWPDYRRGWREGRAERRRHGVRGTGGYHG